MHTIKALIENKYITNYMEIPNEILKFWLKNLERGDKMNISREKKINTKKVAAALDGEDSDSADIIKINDWFKEKVERIQKSLK